MTYLKTATVAASLLLFSIAHLQAETSATLESPAAGLRIQIDAHGNRVQHPVEVVPPVTPATANAPASAALKSAPAAARPQVVKNSAATGTVVRLNGLFRAGSRATIGADGKLQTDCHVDTAHDAKGDH